MVLRLGSSNTPYTGLTGKIVAHTTTEYHVQLDEDPIPRWTQLGIFCFPWEVRSLDNETSKTK